MSIPRPTSSIRILVADDELVSRQVAMKMVQNLGHLADAACSGAQALRLHLAAPYDLLLMDCEMPELDGYEACRLLREQEGAGRHHTPVIALSAACGNEARAVCLAAGMDDFLSKPLRAQALSGILQQWMPRTAGIRECSEDLDTARSVFGSHFPDIAAQYLDDSRTRFASLHAALAQGDGAAVAKLAHAFSGSSAAIGATGISALCRSLELQARQGNLEDCLRRLAQIETEHARLAPKLKDAG